MLNHIELTKQQTKMIATKTMKFASGTAGYLIKLPFTIVLLCFLTTLPGKVISQTVPNDAASPDLTKLSIEELMNIEVISVTKSPEKLSEVASAIQVITQADILRSGAKTLPEALRLASNLQVAQVNSSQWAISARGFNNVLANKLLIMIDGRSIYTPLYAGVFWDIQNLILEDIDRIEVVSGPGGALWGANAVNGVINIITKNTKDTQGLFAEGAFGSNLPGLGSLRYGGQINNNFSYKVYGTGFNMGSTLDSNDLKAKDDWFILQGGFQFDWQTSEKDQLVLAQNIYKGKPNPDASGSPVIASGENTSLRWTHELSPKASFQILGYYDRTWRDFNNNFTEELKTYNLDWYNRYELGKRHKLSYGLNFRMMDHKVTNLELFKFVPEHKKLYLYSIFLQDEILLIKEKLRIIIGGKVEHNSFTGFEYQPNTRLTFTPTKQQTIWAAVSRAVRTPARIDREFQLDLVPGLSFISPNDKFLSETMLAYELGWRMQPHENLSISLAAFHNIYNNIRSAEPGPPPYNIPITFANGVKGKTYGIELSANQQLASWWKLRGGYTFIKKELSVKPGSNDLNKASAESNDPTNQLLIQSTIDLPKNINLGTVIRYVDKLPAPYVSAYTALDLQLGWKLNKEIELNIVGQNLLDKSHTEFIPSSPSPRRIERSIYAKIIWRH